MKCCCQSIEARLGEVNSDPLMDMMWGLEKESLRVTSSGELSNQPHPSVLEEPVYTKDFAETQLEMITPPMEKEECVVGAMESLVRNAKANLPGREQLWPFSMPPALPVNSEIQLAEFDDTVEGNWKRKYREGLVARYGKSRQMISGLHVNVSLGDDLLSEFLGDVSSKKERDRLYLNLVRNLYRQMPLLYLLFSHSPVEKGDTSRLSYRKSGDGYPSMSEYLDYISVEAYVAGARQAMAMPFMENNSDEVSGLNDRLLQSDKELYSPIRLKAHVPDGDFDNQATLKGLELNGIAYLEFRFCDIDPAEAAGISTSRLRLLRLFILDALLGEDVLFKKSELGALIREFESFASSSLDSIADVTTAERTRFINKLNRLLHFASRLDEARDDRDFQSAVNEAKGEIMNPNKLPSVRLWHEYQAATRLDWTQFGAGYLK